MTQITPLALPEALTAAEFMATGKMHRFAQHLGRCYIAATVNHREKILAMFHDLFSLALDTKRVTLGFEGETKESENV